MEKYMDASFISNYALYDNIFNIFTGDPRNVVRYPISMDLEDVFINVINIFGAIIMLMVIIQLFGV